MKHIVLAFCTDLDKDPVSAHVLARLLASGIDWQAEGTLDGHPVLRAQSGGVRYDLLQLDQVLSHDYRRYAPRLNEAFGDADAIVIVNWHEGKNAPDRIFTIQTTGDMESGTFSPVDPAITRSLFLAVEHERRKAGLDSYSTWMEATHWSGPLYGAQPGSLVSAVTPSVIDLEIGSTADAWTNPDAADVLVRALLAAGNTRLNRRSRCSVSAEPTSSPDSRSCCAITATRKDSRCPTCFPITGWSRTTTTRRND